MKNATSTLSGLKLKNMLTKVNIQSEIQFWADRYLTVIDIILLCCEGSLGSVWRGWRSDSAAGHLTTLHGNYRFYARRKCPSDAPQV